MFKELSEVDREQMELSFSMLDVKEVIWCFGPDKSLDPNRFNLGFFKACWDIIKFDLFYCIMEFFQTTHLSKVALAAFLALTSKFKIPKILIIISLFV